MRTAAPGRINAALDRLLARQPFYHSIVSRFHFHANDSLDTMAVGLGERHELELHFNPSFVLAITADELVGVLVHEVLHCVFGHLTYDAARFPDAKALTIAQEVTVNEFIQEPLPGEPLLLRQFPELPPGESTAERYERLVDCREASRTCTPIHRCPTVDDHTLWRGVSDASAADAVTSLLEQAIADRPNDPATLAALALVAAHGSGSLCGVARRFIPQGTSRIAWGVALRRLLSRRLTNARTYRRPNRRLPQLVGVAPGTQRTRRRPRILAVVDTSGSITAESLGQIDAELCQLQSGWEVTVVECDDAIRRVYPYRGLENPLGGGGTDLRPPLSEPFLRTQRAEAVLYFTDGAGPAPVQRPSKPVLWCLVSGGQPPAAWGSVLRLP